ncbi:IS1096 element passenger TnpR family protein, partial [Escherichia coli]
MKIYVIKIAVHGVSPMVWRRLRIAADTSLAALHFIFQIVQGWGDDHRHCCKVSDEAAFCLIQRPYISKTLLTRRISPRG